MKKNIAVACLLGLAGTAQADTLIDDYYVFPFGPIPGFAAVSATHLAPLASASSSTGTILGGERDIVAEVLQAVAFQGDNAFAAATAKNGWFGGYNMPLMTFQVDQGANTRFTVVYDGVDGSPDVAQGLNLDAAALGSQLSLRYFGNYVLQNNDYAAVDIDIELLDLAGQRASVTRTMAVVNYGVVPTLNFSFADFEAANSQFDLTRIGAITLSTEILNQTTLSGTVNLVDFKVTGGAYVPTNVIAPPVPEPATWATLIAGLGMLGALRRRR